jgi:iron complex outermembrane receptor protein
LCGRTVLSRRLLDGVARTTIIVAAFGLPTAAFAEATNELETVVVTAQKRVEPLKEVTASATVVSEEKLQLSGVNTTDDIGKLVPSLQASSSGTNLRSSFSLRGIGTAVLTIGAPSGTAVMIDGITLAPESIAAKQLTDIQNVEVLRGPQSTLGGRAAADGIVNIVTRQPGDTFAGQVQFTVTGDNEQRMNGFVTSPITKELGFSLSGFVANTDFPTVNLTTGNHDSERSAGGRLKLRYAPTEHFDALLTVAISRIDDHGEFLTYTTLDPTANFRNLAAAPQSVALPGITVNSDNFNYVTIGQPGMKTDDRTYSLVLNYSVGDWTFTSTTARQEEDRNLAYDLYGVAVDWPALVSGGTYTSKMMQYSNFKVRTTSQEFKVVSPKWSFVNFIAGLYWDRDETSMAFDRPLFGTPLPYGVTRWTDTHTVDLYARAEWTLLPDLQVITGGRLNYDLINYQNYQRYNTTPASASTPFWRKGSFDQVNPVGDVSIRYHVTDDIMTYASYSRGYKPAVWNMDGTFTPTNTIVPVKREDVNAFEVGMKGSFFNHRLTTNVAGFLAHYLNYQVTTLDPNSVTSTFALSNAGKVTTKGVEFDMAALVTDELNLTASLAFVDAKYDIYKAANCYTGQTAVQGCVTGASGSKYQDYSGHRMAGTPTWKMNLGGNYDIALPDLPFDAQLNATYNWQSKVFSDGNGNPAVVLPAYGIINMGTTFRDRDNKYSVAVFVNNVADQHYCSYAEDFSARWGNKLAVHCFRPRDSQRYFGARLGLNL